MGKVKQCCPGKYYDQLEAEYKRLEKRAKAKNAKTVGVSPTEKQLRSLCDELPKSMTVKRLKEWFEVCSFSQ